MEKLFLWINRKNLQLETLTIDNSNIISTPFTKWRYQCDNPLQSICLELDKSASIISYEEYYPFGTTSYRSGKNQAEVKLKQYRYNGKERDEETGLYYYGARYLAAWIGRFISSDPIGDDFPGLSNYQYASNNPILNIDLDGLEGITGFFFGDQSTARQAAYDAQQKWENPDSNLSNKKIENTPETNCSDSSCTEESLPSEEGSKDSSKPDYSSMAKTLDVEENVLKAIVSVESSGKGFTKNGKVILRFEGHKFKKYLKENGFDVSKLEKENPDLIYDYSEIKSKKHGRTQYEKALKIDSESAKMSTSYGAFQIMGFNYEASGYDNIDDFVKAQNTTKGQVEAFVEFAKSSASRLQAMKDKDFTEFAKLYNGESYKDWNYDIKMQNAYNKLIKK